MTRWLLILVAACSSSGTVCEPGAPEPCACPGGGNGIQLCSDDGSGLGACTGCAVAPGRDAAATCGPGIYPCGPYGYTIGSVIENLALVGKRDDNANGHIDAGDAATVIALADLIAPPVQVLVIDVCAEWCVPCRANQSALNALYQSYLPDGHVAFYDVMLQDKTGQPGDLSAVERWGVSLDVPYPIGADPTALTGPYFTLAAFPMHLVIRTRDMTITYQDQGATDLKPPIDEVLANP
jgi:hypothetical protein